MVKLFIQNMTKYIQGINRGGWRTFPMPEEQLKAFMNEILGDDEEYIITDQENEFSSKISEYADVYKLNSDLNEIKNSIEESSMDEFKAFCKYRTSRKSDITLSELLEDFNKGEHIVLTGVSDLDDLGRVWIDELSSMQIPEELTDYIDYEAFGRDKSFEGWNIFSEYEMAIWAPEN